jgi:hypothetical protein
MFVNIRELSRDFDNVRKHSRVVATSYHPSFGFHDRGAQV